MVMKNAITPTDYKSALKNGLRGGWLFFGEEAYLKKFHLEQTRKTLLGSAPPSPFPTSVSTVLISILKR